MLPRTGGSLFDKPLRSDRIALSNLHMANDIPKEISFQNEM